MANSNFEPKKIVRYAESNVPRNGISTRPAPTVKPSPAAAKAAVQAVVAAPAPPAPTPPTPTPPAPVGETRGFLFDGATELTGSFLGTNSLFQPGALTTHMTITPTWDQEATGSYALFALGTPDGTDRRIQMYIERVSGSYGYRDKLVTQIMSGSNAITKKYRLRNSPNYYSGGLADMFLSVYIDKYGVKYIRENGAATSLATIEYQTVGSETEVLASSLEYLNATDHKLSIGGFNSGSTSYFEGRMDNFAAGYGSNFMGFNKAAKNYNNDSHIPVYYQFEGNLNASKGIDLALVGTEAYESSSL